MNPETVLAMVEELRVLRFFPNDASVLNAIVRLCGSMCANEGQVRWLITRMTSGIYAEWPGIAEMRACFCCRYKPQDGLTAFSSVYPDGLPPDPTAPPRSGIAAPDLKALPQGHEATADPELEAAIEKLAAKRGMLPANPIFGEFAKALREVRTPPPAEPQEQSQPIKNFTPITQEDIDRAVRELHERRGNGGTRP